MLDVRQLKPGSIFETVLPQDMGGIFREWLPTGEWYYFTGKTDERGWYVVIEQKGLSIAQIKGDVPCVKVSDNTIDAQSFRLSVRVTHLDALPVEDLRAFEKEMRFAQAYGAGPAIIKNWDSSNSIERVHALSTFEGVVRLTDQELNDLYKARFNQ